MLQLLRNITYTCVTSYILTDDVILAISMVTGFCSCQHHSVITMCDIVMVIPVFKCGLALR